MNIVNHIFTVDCHVMGEPLRIVIGGIPFLKGNSIMEKKGYFVERFDHLRSALLLEPRGHDNMFGAVLCEPVNETADIGIFFMHSDGYLNMCGHGIIGVVTSIIEMGLINKKIDRVTEVILETPAGLIYAHAHMEDGLVKEVTFRNVPSFVLYSNLKVTLLGFKDISVDIAYGDESILHKNCVVFGNNQVDRSPCGSGTSAMLALKYYNNKIKLNESFINESIIGTRFLGKVVKEVKVGIFDAIIPEIQGKSYITGYHHFIVDSNDPLYKGITLN